LLLFYLFLISFVYLIFVVDCFVDFVVRSKGDRPPFAGHQPTTDTTFSSFQLPLTINSSPPQSPKSTVPLYKFHLATASSLPSPFKPPRSHRSSSKQFQAASSKQAAPPLLQSCPARDHFTITMAFLSTPRESISAPGVDLQRDPCLSTSSKQPCPGRIHIGHPILPSPKSPIRPDHNIGAINDQLHKDRTETAVP
jgi:hypothetical protein